MGSKKSLRCFLFLLLFVQTCYCRKSDVKTVSTSCHVTQTGCSYVLTMHSDDCRGGPSVNLPAMNTSSLTQEKYRDDVILRRLGQMQESIERVTRELSVRSLRHMRQIKKDLRKVVAVVNDWRASGSGGPAGVTTLFPCLPEFTRVGAWPSCYRFSTFNASWHEAREYCSAFGANLLALDSLKEAHIIDYLLNSKPEYQERQSWWTSGNYMVRNQRWMWTSKHHLKPITYSRWAAEELAVEGSSNMHCLLLYKPLKYYWQEAHCNEQHSFICEMDEV